MLENRYRYLDSYGQPHGPLWLAEMRRRWQTGQLGPDTLVCAEEDPDTWAPVSAFPEITSSEAILPPPRQAASHDQPASSWRVWLLLGLAFALVGVLITLLL